VRNVTLLRERLSSGSTFREVRTYPDAGHQLEDTPAFGIARMFLVEQILKAPGGARRRPPSPDPSRHSGPASRLGRGR
jgi:hypothetical protein